MSLGDALADVMLEGRAAGAESAASWAAADASRARSAQAEAELDLYKQQLQTNNWKKHAQELEQLLAVRTAQTSAGLIVVNAMIKVMEAMQPDQREQFRASVAQIARARMQQLDSARCNGPAHMSIQNAFSTAPQNQQLKII